MRRVSHTPPPARLESYPDSTRAWHRRPRHTGGPQGSTTAGARGDAHQPGAAGRGERRGLAQHGEASPGLPSNTLGRTHNSTTAGSDNVCAQGTITYVWIELNPNGLGSDWSKQLWTVMHEAGHGIALGHSDANDCGINGGYPSVGYGGSIMYSGYLGFLSQPVLRLHDEQDVNDLYP
jgi:hypothetical protein